MRFTTALVLAATAVTGAVAQDSFVLGFNSGATDDKGKAKTQADFEKEFKTAQNLKGAPGKFNTIRLYSNVQAGTTDTPIAAFPAAIATNSKLLLGVWASGTDSIDNELKALSSAVEEYGTKLTDLIVGLSIGSEDLYRVSEPGIRNKSGVGNSAEKIVQFIKDARKKLEGTPLSGVKITHVDTWTAWVNESNKAVIDEIDFLSVNAFPFYEVEHDNNVKNGGKLLASAIEATEGVAAGKDVWVTETGWAYTGPDFGAAECSVDNLEYYWKNVGCALFNKRNVFWYTLRDANPANEVKFAITDNLSTTARFDLTCDKDVTLPSASAGNTTHTNGTSSTGNSSSGNSTSSTGSGNSTSTSGGSSSGGSNGGSSGTGSGSGSGAASTASPSSPPESNSASSISLVNAMAMGLSAVFAAAAWAL
ncbi:glycoside hydrolase family 17 protein [Bipolaris zeicola 26-R-13]|uniref:Glycoside hydrolase family 17 protein n=1 Tax=Cochliobolus carbonum (strain 26-R-13) TaxID=930089 RepID=W6XQT2_COCC2|nr:glycoside hydrolase family 17 protein [Bipolaris zeicola 26-R-13]EUC27973.1 glycoside hydrolase family 17 protein [Bipolaris zeicola 26-R-13]